MKRVVVAGSAGQDGRILSSLLAQQNASVLGIERGTLAVRDAVASFRPDEIYYLAAHHTSAERSGAEDIQTSRDVHVRGLAKMIEAAPDARIVYAASSHVFGDPDHEPQNESTPMRPTSAYGITKKEGIELCREARARGVFASAAILYNHESPLRREEFLSQKLIRGALAIRRGEARRVVVGDLSARADFSFAPDVVDALMRIAAADAADDFVVASGESHSVREFAEAVFERAGLDWRDHVDEDRSLGVRSSPRLVGDATKLRATTGWRPTVTFDEMIGRLWQAAVEGERHR